MFQDKKFTFIILDYGDSLQHVVAKGVYEQTVPVQTIHEVNTTQLDEKK